MRKFIPVSELAAEWMKNPEFVLEYDALEEEFALLEALMHARSSADMTQADVAEKMQTSQSYIAKLEGGKVNPTMRALQRYAKATGTKLRFSFVRDKAS